MARRLPAIPAFLALTLLSVLCAAPALALPPAGSPLPEMAIAEPQGPGAAAYLGIPADAKTFHIEDVHSPYVLVQLFNAYCPHCQAEAPDLEKLFLEVSRGALRDRLKILAVGMGNTPFEVKLFRDKYKLTLPMSTDADYAVHKCMGEPGTPSYVLVRNPRKKGEKPVVVFEQEGRFDDEAQFLKTLRAAMDADK
ncbi:Redoxin domain protein [Desulfovibrio sp. X2]|uniref:peroxiredoxin family protein n=1 Tax=Desulfovibrio sp. X2 TaxID=941449 RepID=UPI000358744E|nr:TlpA disulfide reductase family protein [Desulfovibrio sp. X2]EPR37583.1 Redoxin domain protein [Desulfovibrio sp. X2]